MVKRKPARGKAKAKRTPPKLGIPNGFPVTAASLTCASAHAHLEQTVVVACLAGGGR
jgi:hypothetical protein